jgi:uncharacterized membrane protein
MTLPHIINISIHTFAGVAAMFLGFYILSKAKGTKSHRGLGKIFCYLGLVVCSAAALGLAVFRFLPLFAVITLLVSYQLVSGWRVIYTKENGPTLIDAALTALTLVIALPIAFAITGEDDGAKVIILSTFGALVFILIYDCVRWLFPQSWHRFLWRYEHSYKLLSSLFGMLSAFVGNTIRMGQPWSQIGPSVLGLVCICYFFYQLYRFDRQRLAQRKKIL